MEGIFNAYNKSVSSYKGCTNNQFMDNGNNEEANFDNYGKNRNFLPSEIILNILKIKKNLNIKGRYTFSKLSEHQKHSEIFPKKTTSRKFYFNNKKPSMVSINQGLF